MLGSSLIKFTPTLSQVHGRLGADLMELKGIIHIVLGF